MTEPCEACAEHESGCCFACKMDHWRKRGGGVIQVPEKFGMTNREHWDEAQHGAQEAGREIRRKES